MTAALLAAKLGCFHGRAARCVLFLYKDVGTLTHVDLTIRPGECVLLCGASGCGKTTITKLVNGLIPAFTEDCTLTGQVLLHGAPVREQPLYQLARQVGSVFQNPKSQFFNMDSDSELAFGLENQGVARARSSVGWMIPPTTCI